MLSSKRILLRRLFFISPHTGEAGVEFEDGLNVIYGGSNAGKSFVLKAVDFLLGADSLKLPTEGKLYDTIVAWLILPGDRKVTFIRPISSGEFRKIDGHVEDPLNPAHLSVGIAANNKKRSKSTILSLSDLIFEEIDFRAAQVVKNETGEKTSLSLRMIIRFLLIGEEAMVTEGSPVKSADQRLTTEDKSIFRYLLTGRDDSNVIEVAAADELKASRIGKLELLKELLFDLDKRIGSAETVGIHDSLRAIEQDISDWDTSAERLQRRLSELRPRRRQLIQEMEAAESQRSEQVGMSARFYELKSVYERDIERLAAIEEGGVLLGNYVGGPCAVCGAERAHQRYEEDADSLQAKVAAAEKEMASVQRDIEGLNAAILSLNDDIEETGAKIRFIAEEIRPIDAEFVVLDSDERMLREKYRTLHLDRNKILANLSLIAQREDYKTRIGQINLEKIGRQRTPGLPEPIGSASGSGFADEVKNVLAAWNFPSIQKVDFDGRLQDIVVNGT